MARQADSAADVKPSFCFFFLPNIFYFSYYSKKSFSLWFVGLELDNTEFLIVDHLVFSLNTIFFHSRGSLIHGIPKCKEQ